mgnify:CR=1 FL=1
MSYLDEEADCGNRTRGYRHSVRQQAHKSSWVEKAVLTGSAVLVVGGGGFAICTQIGITGCVMEHYEKKEAAKKAAADQKAREFAERIRLEEEAKKKPKQEPGFILYP